MKKIVACFMLCMRIAYGADDSLAAYTHYTHGDYANALSLYQNMSEHNAASWFTMGNCAYMLEQYPQALTYWARAQRTATGSLLYRCIHNSDVVHSLCGHSTLSASSAAVQNVLVRVPVIVVQISLLVMVYGLLYLLYKSGKKKWKMILCLALLCLMMAAVARYRYVHCVTPLFVVHTATTLYAGSQEYHAHLAQIEPACMLKVYDQRDGWYKVYYAGIYGWVPACSGTVE